MPDHLIDADHLPLATLVAWARSQDQFVFAPAALQRLRADRVVVERHAADGTPVYGLNTGLGGNLGYRLADDEVLGFQRQLIAGRMIGMGEPMPLDVVRASMLARVCGLARGGSGVSPAAAQALLDLVNAGVTPLVPVLGSIGAGDLGLCAHMVAPVIGLGEAFYRGKRMTAAQALQAAGLQPVALQAKDGLGLINASPLSAGFAAVVAEQLDRVLLIAAAVAALVAEGYAANLGVYDPRIAQARPAGAQPGAAALFRALLQGSSLYQGPARALQDALSIRTTAQVFGAVYDAHAHARQAVEIEINASSDNPIVFADQGEMVSSPNFHTSVIALAFDALAIALTQLASASVQRIIKLQTPQLSGLPRYLSPVGGASVGFNAMQKTAAAIHAEIRLKAMPASTDAIVVSDTVEDHASHAMLAVRKLSEQLQLMQYLTAIEAMVAAQAVDLRKPAGLGAGSGAVHALVRQVVAPLEKDRPTGTDAMAIEAVLFNEPLSTALRSIATAGLHGYRLAGLG